MAPATDYFGNAVADACASDGMDILDALAGVWVQPGTVAGWTRIRARFDRELTLPECWRVAACIGYAMREKVRSRASMLTDQYATLENAVFKTETYGVPVSVLYFDYDASRSDRTDPVSGAVEAFETAEKYIVNGSPIRKTDQQGPNTAGTRLCEGIGEVGVTFHVYKRYDDGTEDDGETE